MVFSDYFIYEYNKILTGRIMNYKIKREFSIIYGKKILNLSSNEFIALDSKINI